MPVPRRTLVVALSLSLTLSAVLLSGSPAVRAQQAGDPQATFPAMQRDLAEPDVIERGRAIYGISCRSCHGMDLRGGDLGGPNLLRSQLVLADVDGERILPVLRNGSSTPGLESMPPQNLSDDDERAVLEYIYSVLASASRQGGPPEGDAVELDILVGDAAAGEAYFGTHCASCHSASGDLAGLARRVAEPQELQNTWVRGGSVAATRGALRPVTRVTVTEASGASVTGTLTRLDDFVVVLTTDEGLRRSFRRQGDRPRVELDDPLARHTELLTVYTDTDIHNVTAYLATLR